jgi:hypothetical protein
MLNAFGIILFDKVVWWFDDQEIGEKWKRPKFNLLTYIMWSIYIHIYILYICVNLQYLGGLWIRR